MGVQTSAAPAAHFQRSRDPSFAAKLRDIVGRYLALLNAVENFFSKMTRRHVRRGFFRSIADLQAAINAY